MHEFDPGYGVEPFATLVAEYPGVEVYPAADFRVEWGPIFHRGRLDGSARVLVIGQDPGQHETIARRILVGEAGQRAQGFLAKLGISRSYVMVNTFLYSVYGQSGGERHRADPDLVAYRNRWLDALLVGSGVEAVVAFGHLADEAFAAWRATPAGKGVPLAYEHVTHPTEPESSSRGNPAKLAAATAAMLAQWNSAIGRLRPAIAHPDLPPPPALYGTNFGPGDKLPIPEADVPAGLPPWMRSLRTWAVRKGDTPAAKRATIVVTVPSDALPPPPPS